MKKKNKNAQFQVVKSEKLSKLKDELIEKQKRYINQLEAIIEVKDSRINELNLILEDRYKEHDYDLMFNAYLIQAERLFQKRTNKKLRRYTDERALILANKKLKRYNNNELQLIGGKPTEKLTLMKQNYSRTHKPKIKNDIGKILPVLLASGILKP